jgi:hypothetical protein
MLYGCGTKFVYSLFLKNMDWIKKHLIKTFMSQDVHIVCRVLSPDESPRQGRNA